MNKPYNDMDRLKGQFLITEIAGWTFSASFLWLIESNVVQAKASGFTFILLASLLLSNILLHRILYNKFKVSNLFVAEAFIYLIFVAFFVHLTGGLHSFFWFLYFIPIMISIVVLESRNCFLIFAGAVIATLFQTIPALRTQHYEDISLSILQIFGLALFTALGWSLNRWVIIEKQAKDKALYDFSRELELNKGLIELANSILTGKSFTDVLETILKQACHTLGISEAGIWIQSTIQNNQEFLSCIGAERTRFEALCHRIRDDKEGSYYQTEDLENDGVQRIQQLIIKEPSGNNPPVLIRLTSGALHEGGWIGIMFYIESSKGLEDYEKRFLNSVGRMISLALQNQRVIEDLSAALEERSKKIGDLLVLYEITKRMAKSLDFEETIDAVVELTLAALNASVCIIFLLNDNGHVYVAGSSGANRKDIDEMTNNDSDQICIKLINAKEVLSNQDLDDAQIDAWLHIMSPNKSFSGLLSAPMMFKGIKKGALVVLSTDPFSHTESDKQMLETLADHAVIMIENAKTYELLQSRSDELEQSKDYLQKINIELLKQQSQLLEATEELENANKELKNLDKIKNDFVATVSHELRTPLTSIKESVALVLDGVMGQLNDEQTKFLTITRNNVDRLTRLINDLLDFSKLEFGTMGVEKIRVDIKEIIFASIESYLPVMNEKEIAFTWNLPEKSLWVYADPDRIAQVMYNLLSNAYKHTSRGGRIHVDIQSINQSMFLSMMDRGLFIQNALEPYEVEQLMLWNDLVVVSVSDTGTFIKRDDIKRIFEKFTQARLRQNSQEGTGLGLAIVKKILELHQGGVWVDVKSEEEKAFQFCLPSFDETMKHGNMVDTICARVAQIQKKIVLMLFDFADKEFGDHNVDKRFHELNNLSSILTIIQCVKEKQVFRISIRKILVVIYDGDQVTAATLIDQVRSTILDSELKDWVEQMHFSLSDVPYTSTFQLQLVKKLSDMKIPYV